MIIPRLVRLSVVLCALCPMIGQASSAIYSFSSGTLIDDGGNAALGAAIGSSTVLGSFTYNNAVPRTGTGVNNPIAIYEGAVTNISGVLGGIYPFSDPYGRAGVGDEKFGKDPDTGVCAPDDGCRDIANYRSQGRPLPDSISNLVGFQIMAGGVEYTLERFIVFWLEAIEGEEGTPDFLTSDDLLSVPPMHLGALINLIFVSSSGGAFVTFGGVIVTPGLADDGDGIVDTIDTLNGVFSNDFTDGTTFGTIVDRSDLAVQVTDHPDPAKGVVLSANGGTGTAQIQMCSSPVTDVFLNNGGEIIETCGSSTTEMLLGEAVVIIGDVTITIPEGAIALLEVSGTYLTVTNFGDVGGIVIDDGVAPPLVVPPSGMAMAQLPPDDDGDGVPDGSDVCSNTVIPEAAPSALGSNRWRLQNGVWIFTQEAPQAGSKASFSTADTRGCSCEQIIGILGLGKGHRKKGCSTGAMLDWVDNP